MAFKPLVESGAIGGSYGWGSTQVTMTWIGPYSELESFIRQQLGGGYRNAPPAHHPVHYGLFATRITSVTGLGPSGPAEFAHGQASDWKRVAVTVAYEALAYSFAGPWRWVVRYPTEPVTEYIRQEYGTQVWPEAAGPAAGMRLGGNAGGAALLLTRVRHNLMLVQVPEDMILDHTGRPAGIEACLGRLNADEWMGYQPGEMLLQSYRLEPMPHYLGGIGFDPQPLWFNVHLQLIYFSPTPAVLAGGPGGHQLAKHPGLGAWYRPLTFRGRGEIPPGGRLPVPPDTPAHWRYPMAVFSAHLPL